MNYFLFRVFSSKNLQNMCWEISWGEMWRLQDALLLPVNLQVIKISDLLIWVSNSCTLRKYFLKGFQVKLLKRGLPYVHVCMVACQINLIHLPLPNVAVIEFNQKTCSGEPLKADAVCSIWNTNCCGTWVTLLTSNLFKTGSGLGKPMGRCILQHWFTQINFIFSLYLCHCLLCHNQTLYMYVVQMSNLG